MSLPLLTLNGISVQHPTSHRWEPPESLGTGGLGQEVLPGIYSYVMAWNTMAPAEFAELYAIWWENQGVQIPVELPELGAATYVLASYNGVMNPVTHRGFFEGHYQNVTTEVIGIDITA